MAIALKMLKDMFDGSTRRHGRVEALTTLVMWFAAGAFITSTLAATFAVNEPGQLIGAAGGAVAAVIAAICKAV